MWRYVVNIVRRVRKDGVAPAARYFITALLERYDERRFGIHTARNMTRAELGFVNPDFTLYTPSDYYGLRKTLRTLGIAEGRDVFLDVGSGMGRVVIIAATFPFRKVIGVELSSELIAIAKDNIQRARPRLRCTDIEIVGTDATQYAIPDEVTVIYFFSPLVGGALRKVFENIEASHRRAPRKLTVIYKNDVRLLSDIARPEMLAARRRVADLCGNDYVIFDVVG